MTVRENLALGAFGRRHRPPAELDADHERVFALFPRVKERLDQYAGTRRVASSRWLWDAH
jgi:branched-chain amino acid transport system ATP-binding protein